MEDYDTNNTNVKYCRICLESRSPETMIAPCLCKGSIKYVHRECLDRWRAQGVGTQNVTHCPCCKFRYITRQVKSSQETSLARVLLFLFLRWFIIAAAVSFVCGYIGKIGLCFGQFSSYHCTTWTPQTRFEYEWTKEHMHLGALVALFCTGIYALVKGFILWASGSEIDDEPVRMHNEDEMPDAHHRGNYRPPNNDRQQGPRQRRRRDVNYYDDGYYPSTYVPCPSIWLRGGGGGGSGGSGGSKSDKCDCCDVKCDDGKDCVKCLAVIIVIIGVLYLLYVITVSLYKTIKVEYKRVRQNIVQELVVVDLEREGTLNS